MVGGNHALVRATTEDELFQTMCRVIVETGGYRMAWVGQAEHDEEKSIRPLAHAGHEAGYLALAKLSWGDNPHGRGPSGMSVRNGATQFNNDFTANPVMGPWKALALKSGYRSSISLPLRDKAGVFGALTIYASEANAFGLEEVALLEELADDISYGVTALRTRRDHDDMEQTLRRVEERRQAEEALRQSEERFRLLVEQAEDGIFLSDATGQYVDVNTAGHKMLGYARDEILSRTIADVIAPEEASRIAPEVGRLAEGQVARSEWRFRRKDGSEMIGEVVGRQLPDGRLLAILRDVTERKQVEAALCASEERLQLALGAGHMGIWEWDLATGACIWNDETYRLLGYEPGSVTPSYEAWAQRMLPEDLARTEARLRETVERGVPFAAEYRVLGEKDDVRWLEGRGQRLVDKEGRVSRAIGVMVDITAARAASQALQISDQRFRLAMEMSATLAYTMDRELRCTWLHSTVTVEGAVGKTLHDIFVKETADRLAAIYSRVLLTGERVRSDMRVQFLFKPDPQYFDFAVEPLRDARGAVTGIIVAATDITARKQTEEALRESEARMRLAQHATQSGVWEWVLATNRNIWSDGLWRLYGLDPAGHEASYDLWKRSVHPDDRAGAAQLVGDAAAAGEEFELSWRVNLPAGEPERWLLARGRPVTAADGKPERYIGVVIDITERKLAEEALRQEKTEGEFRLLAEAMPQIVWATRADGWNIFFNQQWVEYTGLTLEESYGHGWNKPFHPDDQQRAWDTWQEAVKHNKTYSLECRLRRADGEYRWWLVRGVPLSDENGKIVKWFGTCTDIHELIWRKQVESDLRAAKAKADRGSLAKSKFLAAASHDLRQPVQSLTLLLSALERQVADKPKAANLVSMANASMASLNGMLTAILDISRLDAGVIAPAFASVDLGEVVDRLASEYAPRAAADGLALRQVARKAPPALRARTDVALLERILRNLIENALRYTSKGGVLIGVRQRGERVRLDVIDTGVGIAAEHQTEIFEEFRQLNNPARDSSKGLGLGLAIVSRLAHLIGAEVQVASRVGHGTRFSLLLPIERSAPSPVLAASAIEDAGGRILIIEDNSGIRQAYEIMLEDWGYETLSAASGEEALDRAAQVKWEFDAIIADHRLGPGVTGNAAATEIARRAGRIYPTMLVTGDTAEERLTEVSASGFALLHKPVDAEDLRRTLASLLRGGGVMVGLYPGTSQDKT